MRGKNGSSALLSTRRVKTGRKTEFFFAVFILNKKPRTCITFDSDLLMELNIKVAKKEIKSVSCYIEELVLKDKAKLEKIGTKRHSDDNIDDLADM